MWAPNLSQSFGPQFGSNIWGPGFLGYKSGTQHAGPKFWDPHGGFKFGAQIREPKFWGPHYGLQIWVQILGFLQQYDFFGFGLARAYSSSRIGVGYIGFGFRWVWVPLGSEQSCSSLSFDMGTETMSSSMSSSSGSILTTEPSGRAFLRFRLRHEEAVACMPACRKAGQGGVALKVVALHRGSPAWGPEGILRV